MPAIIPSIEQRRDALLDAVTHCINAEADAMARVYSLGERRHREPTETNVAALGIATAVYNERCGETLNARERLAAFDRIHYPHLNTTDDTSED